MKTPLVRLSSALALLVLLTTQAKPVRANGAVTVKNCYDGQMHVCLYDWNDSVRTNWRSDMRLQYGETKRETCRKSWSDPDAPGCYVKSSIGEGCNVDWKKRYSGGYTTWAVEGGSSYSIRSGIAADCNGGNPTEFTLSGSEVSGCTPRAVIYGEADKSGAAYVLENFAVNDMNHYLRDSMKTMDNWVRAVDLSSGEWEICDGPNFTGTCIRLGQAPTSLRLDAAWSGEWDQRISSMRPISCR